MPADYVPEIPADFVQVPQFVEEITLGTTPTASPIFKEIGKIFRWNITHDTTNRKFRVLGSEDLLTAVKTGEAFAIQCSFHMFANALTKDFIKYLINARGGGAGSIDKTLSILWSHKVNAVEQYEIASMVRPNTGSIEVTPDEVTVDMSLIAAAISAPSTVHGLTTPTFITPNTSNPLVGTDSGANPFTHNTLNYDTPRFRMEFGRSLHAIRVNGKLNIIDNPATKREISGSFDVIRKNNVLKADAKSLAKRSAAYTLLASPAISVSFTDLQIEQLTESYEGESTEVISDTYGFFAKAATMA